MGAEKLTPEGVAQQVVALDRVYVAKNSTTITVIASLIILTGFADGQ
jgi:hypothetical protein